IFSRVYAHITAAFMAVLRGDLAEARPLADEGDRLATQHGPLNYVTLARGGEGGIAVRSGDFENGLHNLKKDLPDDDATRAQISLPVFLSFLASALSECGKSEEGFATIAEALRLSETTLEACWEPELYRLKGELTLSQSSVQSLESRVQTEQKAKGK